LERRAFRLVVGLANGAPTENCKTRLVFIQGMGNQHHGVMDPDLQSETPSYVVPVER
jgi:hypothetical protein